MSNVTRIALRRNDPDTFFDGWYELPPGMDAAASVQRHDELLAERLRFAYPMATISLERELTEAAMVTTDPPDDLAIEREVADTVDRFTLDLCNASETWLVDD